MKETIILCFVPAQKEAQEADRIIALLFLCFFYPFFFIFL
ncbi:hypothetical protein CLOSTHATH_07494 [Hungatella hathewayi DSM 13479]|uniref:Uncharacterized protein n=1 Tax=Hungatella hathewayi DSM 13479 TaxID=566550 RepID=D3AV22_9FIRM|nr:hypothetical protein CLOSTHATH_07494 [Hungatella hathewayi DSM 13479]